MFEDRTYENIMAECLETAPPDVDIRQGGIFFDAVASACFKIAEYYQDLSTMFDLTFISTAVGEYLDDGGSQHAVTRNPATAAKYAFSWTGEVEPTLGDRFFANNLYFLLRERTLDGERILYLEAESLGMQSNSIAVGTPAIPMGITRGLQSATFGKLIEAGADIESDGDYRRRIMARIAAPSENGNKQHYRTWAEEIPGCTRARVIPLFAGPNTVMVVCIGPDGLPAGQPVVERVQEHIDPMTLGITVEYLGEDFPVGDGRGGGRANIGAHLGTIAAERVYVTLSFNAELSSGVSVEHIRSEAEAGLVALLKDLSLNPLDNQTSVIRISSISQMLYSLSGLIDYTSLTLNGGTANIELSVKQVGVVQEVIVNAPV